MWAGLGGNGGFYAIRLTQHDGKRVTAWPGVHRRAWIESIVRDFSWNGDLEWSARPYLDRGSRRLMASTGAVWVRTESGRQASALSAFPLEPSLVLREGGSPRHVAFWFMRRELDYEDGVKVNRHLAHALRVPKKWAEQMVFAPPGAVIRSGKRPVQVGVAGGSEELYSMRQLARHLPRRIPDPLAWRSVAARA